MFARYSKALAAFVIGLAAALALLPTDADPRLLALIPVVNALAVALAPRNAPTAGQRAADVMPPGWTPPEQSKPTTHQPPPRPPSRPFE
jgi:hypothetical protein